MAEVNMEVDAAYLRSLAESVDKAQNGLRTSCYAAKGQIDQLKGVWTGDAANTYQTSFQKLMDECNESLATLGKMVNSIYESADRYDKTIKAVQNDAKDIPKLPTDLFK